MIQGIMQFIRRKVHLTLFFIEKTCWLVIVNGVTPFVYSVLR